ncbi:hypothetical protein [Pseudomonas veronii]|uniref:hypothetical protein n=1 Tax=Pseudomonas veronii TaxID=76761 RepID=UPI0026587885|nr:hypothetical protein [Pseudomonas veronii]WKC46934.1 hypothetical protein QYP03_00390 [Pseudomonas veronii]
MTFVDLGKMPIHKVHVLPARVQELIMLLMRELGLVFGCFDLILTPEGEYIFLEVNPNGQWLWIESLTGMKITSAIAALLARSATANSSCW